MKIQFKPIVNYLRSILFPYYTFNLFILLFISLLISTLLISTKGLAVAQEELKIQGVIQDDNNEVISEAMVLFLNLEGKLIGHTYTDPNGIFEQKLQHGKYLLIFIKNNETIISRNVTVKPGDNKPKKFKVPEKTLITTDKIIGILFGFFVALALWVFQQKKIAGRLKKYLPSITKDLQSDIKSLLVLIVESNGHNKEDINEQLNSIYKLSDKILEKNSWIWSQINYSPFKKIEGIKGLTKIFEEFLTEDDSMLSLIEFKNDHKIEEYSDLKKLKAIRIDDESSQKIRKIIVGYLEYCS